MLHEAEVTTGRNSSGKSLQLILEDDSEMSNGDLDLVVSLLADWCMKSTRHDS